MSSIGRILGKIVRSRGDFHPSGQSALYVARRLDVNDPAAARTVLKHIATTERATAEAAETVAELAEAALAELDA